MMNCYCCMVKRRKTFSLVSRRGHCQRSSTLWISDTPQAGFETAQNLSSGFDKWRFAVVIATTPWGHREFWENDRFLKIFLSIYLEKFTHTFSPFAKCFSCHLSEWFGDDYKDSLLANVSKEETYGDISVFSSNAGKYGPKETPYLDTFHAVRWFLIIVNTKTWSF